MKIAMLSDGGWSTALSLLLNRNGHQVTLWGPFADYIEVLKTTRKNVKYLPAAEFPPEINLTADLQEAVTDADVIVLALPSQFMRGLLERLVKVQLPKKAIYVDVTKGIEVDTLKRMSELVQEFLGDVPYCVLSGPSHAEEVFKGVPTVVTAASKSEEVSKQVQQVFMGPTFRVYRSSDVIGVELGGALKNVIALAAGACDGMQMGDNTKAALMTRGILEIARMGIACGGRPETFAGLSGVGDLIVTCMSHHSRNHFVGEEYGKGLSLEEIKAKMHGMVAEGLVTAKSAYQLACKMGVEVPIIERIYKCIYENANPKEVLLELMLRDPKEEVFQ